MSSGIAEKIERLAERQRADEIARYSKMSADEKLDHMVRACRTAVRMARLLNGDAFKYVDPIPESSAKALKRLREQSGWGE